MGNQRREGIPERFGNLVTDRSLGLAERGTSKCLATERSRAVRRRDPGKPTVARKAELSVLADAPPFPRIAPSGGRETGASRKRQSPVDSAGFLERRADRENPGERRKTPVPVRTELRIRSPR